MRWFITSPEYTHQEVLFWFKFHLPHPYEFLEFFSKTTRPQATMEHPCAIS